MYREHFLVGLFLIVLTFGCQPEKRITSPPSKDTSSGNPCSTNFNCPAGEECTNGYCMKICVPNCTNRECGSDGCGGYCGTCPQGTACDPQGLCAAKPCTPQCSGKQCGSNGCGGSCGTCPALMGCNGVGKCDSGSGCLPNCTGKICGPDGCGSVCGKCPAGFMCNDTSQCSVDPSACSNLNPAGECQQNNQYVVRCLNGQLLATYCDPELGLKCGFSAVTQTAECIKDGCAPNCLNKQCGPDGCGGVCGVCPLTENCNTQGICSDTCTPNCAGKYCGPNGCGGQCGTCDTGYKCSPTGQCIDPSTCTPNCFGKKCGPDGCGGSCGTCSSGQYCDVGQCLNGTSGCTPNCAGKTCGNDGCGGSCGSCPASQQCDVEGHCVTMGGGACGSLTFEGQCNDTKTIVSWCEGGVMESQDCTVFGSNYQCAWMDADTGYWCLDKCNCTDKECGDNGCGESCGSCPTGQNCNNSGICVGSEGEPCGSITWIGVCEGNTLKYCSGGTINESNCGEVGKVCGWSADFNWYSCIAPTGSCQPNCVNKECGDDGCGNLCGLCSAGESCTAGQCGFNTSASQTCDTVPPAGLCIGSSHRQCTNNLMSTTDCALSNQVCLYIPSTAKYGCAPNPGCWGQCPEKKRCQYDGTCGCDGLDIAGHCEDQTMVYCINNDYLVTTNCADNNLSCVINDFDYAVCQ